MSELTQKQWTVLSERGCEVSGVTYDEAVRRVRELVKDKVHALSVITDEAARRLTTAKQPEEMEKDAPPQQR